VSDLQTALLNGRGARNVAPLSYTWPLLVQLDIPAMVLTARASPLFLRQSYSAAFQLARLLPAVIELESIL
jgi:hypothetical protein